MTGWIGISLYFYDFGNHLYELTVAAFMKPDRPGNYARGMRFSILSNMGVCRHG
jgi:hypothetical protein